MTSPEDRSLSLSEWLVLCLVREQPRHGFAIARLLEADGSLGKVWRGPQPGIYPARAGPETVGAGGASRRPGGGQRVAGQAGVAYQGRAIGIAREACPA